MVTNLKTQLKSEHGVVSKFLLRLPVSPFALSILKSISIMQVSILDRIDQSLVLERIKADFVIMKSFALCGTLPPGGCPKSSV
jgi:hypothetical protein